MVASKFLLGLSFLAAGLAPAIAQGIPVDISGTVTDQQGAPLRNAKVALAGRDLATTTDAAGKYSLKAVPASLGSGSVTPGLRVEARGGSLELLVASVGRRVSLSVHDLSGAKVAEVLHRTLEAGTWSIDPFPARLAAGTYVVSLASGGSRRTFRMHRTGMGPGSALPASPAEARLLKTAAAPETLTVVAVGYERGERVVHSPSGTQDFRLGPLKWTNVAYKPAGSTPCSRCILDVRKPNSGSPSGKGWPVIIHFHGGGMTGGDRNEPFGGAYNDFGQKYLDNGLMVVTPGYTLAGGNTTVWPQYLRDAATAAAWVRKNIESYGGDPRSVFISGFSAGAYLTHMLSIDTTWLKEAGSDVGRFAGYISMSGQTRTHDNIRNDLRVSDIMREKPYAMPMGHIRRTAHPWQIIVGSLEGGTIDSNRALYEALMGRGSQNLSLEIIPGQGHTCSDMGNAASVKRDKLLAFIDRYKAK